MQSHDGVIPETELPPGKYRIVVLKNPLDPTIPDELVARVELEAGKMRAVSLTYPEPKK